MAEGPAESRNFKVGYMLGIPRLVSCDVRYQVWQMNRIVRRNDGDSAFLTCDRRRDKKEHKVGIISSPQNTTGWVPDSQIDQ